MKKIYSRLAIIISVCMLASSCTIHPFAYTNPKTGGEVASLGASLLTKTKSENAFLKKGDMIMGYNMEGKSEVSVPNTYLWSSALSSAIDSVAGAAKSFNNNASAEALQSIKSAETVSLAKEATEVAKIVPVP